MQSRTNKLYTPRVYRNIDEPVVSGHYLVYVQNSRCGSRFNIYNTKNGEYKYIVLKNIVCFNLHGEGNRLSFEYCGNIRGIGIIYIEGLLFKELGNITACDILCGMCHENLVIKRGSDILLHNIDNDNECIIVSNHHISSIVIADGKYVAWHQTFKSRPCVVVHDIEGNMEYFFSAIGKITKMYISGDNIVCQDNVNNKCSILIYNIKSGVLQKCYEDENWIELYKGSSKTVLWTVRKESCGKYLYDVWIYNLQNKAPLKVLSDYSGVIIPAASNRFIFWVDENAGKCNAFVMHLDI